MAVRRGQLGVKKGLKRATTGANGEHISDCSIRRLARRGGATPAAAALSRKEVLPLQRLLPDFDSSKAWLHCEVGERL